MSRAPRWSLRHARTVAVARTEGDATGPTLPGRRERGQALVMFILMSVVMIGAVAIVTDIAWAWYGQQRMQRAADAAALAGAIYLPGNAAAAYSAAQAESTRNGFTNGAGGVTVTPLKDPLNARRLIVTVSGPVGSFFARALGINQFSIGATSRAVYILPVPMGSPDDYYGVGDFLATVSQTSTTTTTGSTTTGTSGTGTWVYTPGNWTQPASVRTQDCANGTGTCSTYATSASAANSPQDFAQMAVSVGSTPAANQTFLVSGIEVRVRARLNTATPSGCKLTTQLSWDGGTTWSNGADLPLTSNGFPSTGGGYVSEGSSTSTAAWGSHNWAYNDFSNSNFRTRLTWVRGSGCGSTIVAQVDYLQVRVTYRVDTTNTITTYSDQTRTIQSPTGVTLPSKGFWGAIITSGGNRSNGDQFSPKNSGSGPNPDYDPNGYDYSIVIKGASGQVQIFDAPFCEVGSNGTGGTRGTGDHWIGGAANSVTTIYSLYNENGTPYITTDDTLVATSGNLFANEIQADATQGSTPNNTLPHTGLPDCSTDAYHNAWYRIASGLSAGTYRLNVSTVDSRNDSTNAENMWSIWASSASGAKIYGEGKMVAYTNLTAGRQTFYLAQIEAVHAGKTMQIVLHDPGDVSGNAYLRVQSPDGNAYNYANFSYTATNGLSGNNVNVIQTANGSSLFDNQQITILIPLPTTYGASGLRPPGETEDGWWKIEYQVNGGNDTTTWQVSIRGSPVHLVVP
jgi:hypothetical protein